MTMSNTSLIVAAAAPLGIIPTAPIIGVVDASMITAIVQGIVLLLGFFMGQKHEKRKQRSRDTQREDAAPQDPGSAGVDQ